MENVLAFLTLIALAAVVAGCIAGQAAPASPPLTISADIGQFMPAMSSTVGIGLTPGYGAMDNETVSFRWQTDYGYFLSWGPPDFKVRGLGSDVTGDDSKVYWSYDPSASESDKPPAHVTLTMIDRSTVSLSPRDASRSSPMVVVSSSTVS